MNKKLTHNKFDEISLEYAMNASIVTKIQERFETYGIYLLECIDIDIKKHLKKFSAKHKGYKFSQDSSDHEELSSSVFVKYKENIILEFSFGFDFDFKIKNKEEFEFSREGYSFFTKLHFYKDIIGDQYSLNKYWDSNLKVFCQNNKWGLHNHKDDNEKWIYISLLPVDSNFSFENANRIVLDDLSLLFKNKKEFSIFADKIRNQSKLPNSIHQ